MKTINHQSDHDLLIELRTRMEDIRTDIKSLAEGTTNKLVDLEKRIQVLENSKATYLNTIYIYTAVGASMIGLILYHIFQK